MLHTKDENFFSEKKLPSANIIKHWIALKISCCCTLGHVSSLTQRPNSTCRGNRNMWMTLNILWTMSNVKLLYTLWCQQLNKQNLQVHTSFQVSSNYHSSSVCQTSTKVQRIFLYFKMPLIIKWRNDPITFD